MIKKIVKKLIKLYDFINCKTCLDPIEKATATIAIISLVAHFSLILVGNIFNLQNINEFFGTNYLNAITTPLNIILIYEVFQLILALPRSIIVSIQKQFEVISLIIVREAFKVFGTLDIIKFEKLEPDIALNISVFLMGGIICFALVSVMKLLAYKLIINEEKTTDLKLISLKKILSLLLIIVLAVLSMTEVFILALNGLDFIDYLFDYLHAFFFILIFVDILIFLLSIYFTDDYGFVFLDSALVVSTIIVRFALSLESVEKVATVLFAFISALSVIAVFNYLWKAQKIDLV